jgi:hypothetical protein
MKDNKLTAQDIINFFKEKPLFNRSESAKHGWSPTYGGLYSITDMYKFFEEKGFDDKEVDDVKWKYIQTDHGKDSKLEKGKTHRIYSIQVKNFNPDYSRDCNYCYYYSDITHEEAIKLKEMYEKESKSLMVLQIEKTKASRLSIAQTQSAKTKSRKNTKPSTI